MGIENCEAIILEKGTWRKGEWNKEEGRKEHGEGGKGEGKMGERRKEGKEDGERMEMFNMGSEIWSM